MSRRLNCGEKNHFGFRTLLKTHKKIRKMLFHFQSQKPEKSKKKREKTREGTKGGKSHALIQ